jgi:Na+-driven multidrug efflux pump
VHIHSSSLVKVAHPVYRHRFRVQRGSLTWCLPSYTQVLKRTLQLGTVTGLVIGGAMAIGASALPSVFSSDAQVVGMARSERFASALDACSCRVLPLLLLLLSVGRTLDAWLLGAWHLLILK